MDTWRGRLDAPETSKEARFMRVAEAVAALVSTGGPQKVTLSAVARRAGVSRPWIYKYFGSDPALLVTEATRIYADAFADLGRSCAAPDVSAWRAAVRQATLDGLRDTVAVPWCVALYFRHRNAPDGLGRAIREAERMHVERFLGDLPKALRRDAAADRRFVEFFTASRLGAYHRWIDPEVRAGSSEEAAVDEILRPLDHWATQR